MALLYGLVAVALIWGLVNSFAYANTAALAKAGRVIGGVLALVIAVLLGVRGRIDIALALAGVGAWLLGWGGLRLPDFGGRAQQSPGRISRVRSLLVEMTLDHDTGEMDGIVLAGPWVGRQLNSLDAACLQLLLTECRTDDSEGVRLLEAYLDQRFPRWRQTAQDQEPPKGAQAPSGAMTDAEAYQILGLQPGANLNAIHQAHRRLMKKLHPDQGGSTYLAARVNQARDYLVRQQR
jgi:hypothetical protein